MQHYTLVRKRVACPAWRIPVTMTAKYIYDEDLQTARFATLADCSIIENLRKPRHMRDPDLDIAPFCGISDCPLRRDFPPVINP